MPVSPPRPPSARHSASARRRHRAAALLLRCAPSGMQVPLLLALLGAVLALSWAVPLAVAGDWRGGVVWRSPDAAAGGGYRSYGARWHTLAIFVTQTFSNAFLWISFAPVAELTQRYYGVSVTAVNMLSVIFMILYAPGSYLAMHLITTSGLRRTMVVGALLNAAGSLVRLGSVWAVSSSSSAGGGGAGYAVVLVGQALPGLAQPLFTNVPAKLAADWFSDSQRDVATVIGALGNVLGNFAGQVIPTLLVTCLAPAIAESSASGGGDDYGGGDGSSSVNGSSLSAALTAGGGGGGDQEGQCPSAQDVSGMEALLLVQAVLTCSSTVWTLCCFEGLPPSPPSQSAAKQQADAAAQRTRASFSARATIEHHAVSLLRNPEFRKLLVGFGVGLAVFNAMLTVLGQLILPLHMTMGHGSSGGGGGSDATVAEVNAATSDAGLYGGVLIGAGLVGASIVGPVLDATHAYRTALKGGFLLATASLTFLLTQLRPDNQLHLAIGFGMMGFSMMPLLPVALETAVEVSYPVPEEMSATLLMLVGNIGGLGATYLLQYLISREPQYNPHRGTPFSPAAWFLLISVGCSVLVILRFKGKYRRLEAEREAAATAAAAASIAGAAVGRQGGGGVHGAGLQEQLMMGAIDRGSSRGGGGVDDSVAVSLR